jgi:hypothetical protein
MNSPMSISCIEEINNIESESNSEFIDLYINHDPPYLYNDFYLTANPIITIYPILWIPPRHKIKMQYVLNDIIN